ncbi:MAG TPA: CocE/NonD family hydrolase [Terriglobales bacterium]|nr:CocE/NonD family hydrolase [Terriglobales bacterium]
MVPLACGCVAQADQAANLSCEEKMVPVRDGVHLQTVICRPKNETQPLAIMFTRTPYGVPKAEDPPRRTALEDHPYIWVFQNIRGRFKSEGQFLMQRPPIHMLDRNAIDETTDAYDSIDWLLKNVPNNNGNVGMWGISYSGWTTAMAMLGPHPALKAVSEQASPADMFLGDDFHHNGAFRLSYGFEYSSELETSKEANTFFNFDRYDKYDWYLSLGALSNANTRYFHGNIPTWNDFVNHPNYDDFWKKQVFATYLKQPTVPNLNVAGWWDQEDFYGPQKIYELLEKNDTRHMNYFVAGPWNHGGWARRDCTTLGPFNFGRNTCDEFRRNVMGPFFASYLYGSGDAKQPEAVTFQTGSNQWKNYDSWPPRSSESRKLYFRADGKLAWEAPADSVAAFDSYVSDPRNPVPYRHRPITATYPGPEWPVWLLEDQRFVEHRPDVLTWQTEPLSDDLTITGDIVADLFASTSGTDSDWIVKLIDVYPEDAEKQEPGATPGSAATTTEQKWSLNGYELIIADEVFRGRFRQGFETPQPIAANQPLEYRIDLHTNDHVFLKGHRIMVQVLSTWFPLIDRNPQKFVPNIFQAGDSDYVPATQRIYRTRAQASGIVLPVAR